MLYKKLFFLLGHLILQVMSKEDPCPVSLRDPSLMNCRGKTNVRIVYLKNTNVAGLVQNVFVEFPSLAEIFITNASLCNIDNLFRGLKNVLMIDLSENCVSHVSTSFQNLTTLMKLSLKFNMITEIENHSFSSLKNLRELHLDENLIESIGSRTFQTNSSLRKLYLYDNRLSNVDFLRNLNMLEYLDLSQNSISEVFVDQFSSMVNLRCFHCSYNSISDLRFLKSAINLHYLDLSYNEIETVPVDVFYALKNINQMFLSHNKITQIASGTFSELKNLENLDLSHNLLIYIGEILTYLPRLRLLHIDHNNLKRFVCTTVGNVTIFIDGNEWFCDFLAKLLSVKTIVLNYTFYSNVSHYNGIPCVDNIKEHEEFFRTVVKNQFYIYICLAVFICAVVFITILFIIIISIVRCIRMMKINEEGNIFNISLPMSDGGYMTPRPVCPNIYEEIHDMIPIRQSSFCGECVNNARLTDDRLYRQ